MIADHDEVGLNLGVSIRRGDDVREAVAIDVGNPTTRSSGPSGARGRSNTPSGFGIGSTTPPCRLTVSSLALSAAGWSDLGPRDTVNGRARRAFPHSLYELTQSIFPISWTAGPSSSPAHYRKRSSAHKAGSPPHLGPGRGRSCNQVCRGVSAGWRGSFDSLRLWLQ